MSTIKTKEAVGQCYASSFETMLDMPDDAVLVHGYPRLTGGKHKGRKFGHAWVEREIDGTLWVCDCERQKVILGVLYYAVGRIDPDECKRYSRKQAIRLALETEVYGPWGKQPKGVLFGNE